MPFAENKEIYNRIVLVGNGLDLAAGLPTSYNDFIEAYLKNAAIQVLNGETYSSALIEVSRKLIRLQEPTEEWVKAVESADSITEILNVTKRFAYVDYKYEFLKEALDQLSEIRWVDLEQFYFDRLKFYYRQYGNKSAFSLGLKNIQLANECMKHLSDALHDYIKGIQQKGNIRYGDSPLEYLIEQCIEPLKEEVSELVPKHRRKSAPAEVVFLNFNYTNTIRRLTSHPSFREKCHNVHIHGSVDTASNPIILGYGDDAHEDYLTMENSGENEFLRMIKSFQYPRTRNYHQLLSILSNAEFDVFIVGHSCGLSDRTLLKTIFEHKNCLAIQNFHFQGEQEDFNKRMDISGHFSNKVLMRERVLPFDKHAEIPQLK